MKSLRIPFRRTLGALAAALALSWGSAAQAHCDTLDGPVVSAARHALEGNDVDLVLGWVQKKDEGEIREAFRKASAVRKAGGAAKDLAESYFFETLVRVHRAGEGAPYTGLKPAGQVHPAIAAADTAIATGKLEPVGKLVTDRMHEGLHKQFEAVTSKKKFAPKDVAAARAYVAAYVEYTHYLERLYDAAGTGDPHAAKPGAEHGPSHAH